MKFDVLKKSHLKRNILIGVIAVLIISAIVLNFTRAKYRVTESIPLVNGTINYKPYDFKMIAMYQESDKGEYIEIDKMPSSGYVINEEESYCTVDGTNKDQNAQLYTNENGEHVISNLQKGSKCYLYFDEYKSTAGSQILAEKDIQERNDFSVPITNIVTGIIYQTTDWEGTSYYFAGNPTDNWVSFGGYYWRIIRINGDGSIRLIYNGTNTSTTGTNTMINNGENISFNGDFYQSEYVGFKYTIGSQHGQTIDSTILNSLQLWYVNSNLVDYATYIDSNIGFCSDRNTTSGSWSSTTSQYYAGYGRLYTTKNPSLACSNNDIIKESVGLITADEVAYAGGVYVSDNTSYYLYNNQNYWTMSPYLFSATSSFAYVFRVRSDGALGYGLVEGSNGGASGVRPVINLRSDVQLSGSGTMTDPYVVQTD